MIFLGQKQSLQKSQNIFLQLLLQEFQSKYHLSPIKIKYPKHNKIYHKKYLRNQLRICTSEVTFRVSQNILQIIILMLNAFALIIHFFFISFKKRRLSDKCLNSSHFTFHYFLLRYISIIKHQNLKFVALNQSNASQAIILDSCFFLRPKLCVFLQCQSFNDYIIIDQSTLITPMNFSMLFLYQQPIFQFSDLYFVQGVQSGAQGFLPNTQSNLSQQEKSILIKQEQNGPVTQITFEKQQLKTQKQAIITIVAEEKVKSFIEQPSKTKRQPDSFTQRRNIIPNNINHILAFIQRKSKSQHLVQRIIDKQNLSASFTSKKYYCYQTYLKQKLHIHVNKETLNTISNYLELTETIFSVEQQLYYNKISRTLICYYIRQMAKLKILSSGRVKCTSKMDHLKAHRTLLRYLAGIYDNQ